VVQVLHHVVRRDDGRHAVADPDEIVAAADDLVDQAAGDLVRARVAAVVVQPVDRRCGRLAERMALVAVVAELEHQLHRVGHRRGRAVRPVELELRELLGERLGGRVVVPGERVEDEHLRVGGQPADRERRVLGLRRGAAVLGHDPVDDVGLEDVEQELLAVPAAARDEVRDRPAVLVARDLLLPVARERAVRGRDRERLRERREQILDRIAAVAVRRVLREQLRHDVAADAAAVGRRASCELLRVLHRLDHARDLGEVLGAEAGDEPAGEILVLRVRRHQGGELDELRGIVEPLAEPVGQHPARPASLVVARPAGQRPRLHEREQLGHLLLVQAAMVLIRVGDLGPERADAKLLRVGPEPRPRPAERRADLRHLGGHACRDPLRQLGDGAPADADADPVELLRPVPEDARAVAQLGRRDLDARPVMLALHQGESCETSRACISSSSRRSCRCWWSMASAAS
jgi:hypothetical protein